MAPPPPKVTVALPVQQPVTRYLEVTGIRAAVNTADLVARVPGFVQEINYKDGRPGQEGQRSSPSSPSPTSSSSSRRRPREAGAQATLKQTQADFDRQADLVEPPGRQRRPRYDNATANRDTAQAKLQAGAGQYRAGRAQRRLRPGEGAVRRHRDGAPGLGRRIRRRQRPDRARHHRADRSDLRELQHQRAGGAAAARGHARAAASPATISRRIPVEVGLQTETGYPHRGTLDYVAPTVDRVDRHAGGARDLAESGPRAAAGLFRARAHPAVEEQNALLVPDAALGSDQGGRYVLVVNKDNVVEQRNVTIGPLVDDLRVIESGLEAGRSRRGRRHAARHSGPEGRSAARATRDAGARRGAAK